MQKIVTALFFLFIMPGMVHTTAPSLVWEDSNADDTSSLPWIVGQMYHKLLKKYPAIFKHTDQKELLDHYYFFRALCAERIDFSRSPNEEGRELGSFSTLSAQADRVLQAQAYLIPDVAKGGKEEQFWQQEHAFIADTQQSYEHEKKDARAWLSTVEALLLAGIANRKSEEFSPTVLHFFGYDLKKGPRAFIFSRDAGTTVAAIAQQLSKAQVLINSNSQTNNVCRPSIQLCPRTEPEMLDKEFSHEKKALWACRTLQVLQKSAYFPQEIAAQIVSYSFSEHDLVALWRINRMYAAGKGAIKKSVPYEEERFKLLYDRVVPQELKASNRLGMPRISVDQWYQRTQRIPQIINTLIADLPTADAEEKGRLFKFAYTNIQKHSIYPLILQQYFKEDEPTSQKELTNLIQEAQKLVPSQGDMFLLVPAEATHHPIMLQLPEDPFGCYDKDCPYSAPAQMPKERRHHHFLEKIRALHTDPQITNNQLKTFLRLLNFTALWDRLSGQHLAFFIQSKKKVNSSADQRCAYTLLTREEAISRLPGCESFRFDPRLMGLYGEWYENYENNLCFYRHTDKSCWNADSDVCNHYAAYLTDGSYALVGNGLNPRSVSVSRFSKKADPDPLPVVPQEEPQQVTPAPTDNPFAQKSIQKSSGESVVRNQGVMGAAVLLVSGATAAVLAYVAQKKKSSKHQQKARENSSRLDSMMVAAV